jgi:hypothetical protein
MIFMRGLKGDGCRGRKAVEGTHRPSCMHSSSVLIPPNNKQSDCSFDKIDFSEMHPGIAKTPACKMT